MRASLAIIPGVILAAWAWPSCQQKTPDAPSAATVLADASADSKKNNKPILVVLGASWCKPCKQFWEDLHQEPFSPVVEKNFVVVKLTAFEHEQNGLENAGAIELYKKWTKGEGRGIPYYAVLSASGELLADSIMSKRGQRRSMVGLTAERGEFFVQVLRKTCPKLKKADADALLRYINRPFGSGG